jgi:hypothetical protein
VNEVHNLGNALRPAPPSAHEHRAGISEVRCAHRDPDSCTESRRSALGRSATTRRGESERRPKNPRVAQPPLRALDRFRATSSARCELVAQYVDIAVHWSHTIQLSPRSVRSNVALVTCTSSPHS